MVIPPALPQAESGAPTISTPRASLGSNLGSRLGSRLGSPLGTPLGSALQVSPAASPRASSRASSLAARRGSLGARVIFVPHSPHLGAEAEAATGIDSRRLAAPTPQTATPQTHTPHSPSPLRAEHPIARPASAGRPATSALAQNEADDRGEAVAVCAVLGISSMIATCIGMFVGALAGWDFGAACFGSFVGGQLFYLVAMLVARRHCSFSRRRVRPPLMVDHLQVRRLSLEVAPAHSDRASSAGHFSARFLYSPPRRSSLARGSLEQAPPRPPGEQAAPPFLVNVAPSASGSGSTQ